MNEDEEQQMTENDIVDIATHSTYNHLDDDERNRET
jgi:hypothetical protein